MQEKKIIDPKRSRSAKRAKRKGSGTERTVANLLGVWFYNDADMFNRVPSSGGLRWSKKVMQTRGDIIPSDDDWPYSLEIKNQEGNEWDLYPILFGQGPILKKWWAQCEEDASVTEKCPWLIFKRNNVPFLSLLPQAAFTTRFLKRLPLVYFNIKPSGLILSSLADVLDANRKFSMEELMIANETLIQRNIINVLKRGA